MIAAKREIRDIAVRATCMVRRQTGKWLAALFPTCPRNVVAVVVFSRAMGWKNKLYFGDNPNTLRDCVADASLDLIYLHPPFNSNANYSVLFKEKSGEESAAQIMAFEDTWQCVVSEICVDRKWHAIAFGSASPVRLAFSLYGSMILAPGRWLRREAACYQSAQQSPRWSISRRSYDTCGPMRLKT
jgi:hypothetical protein